LMTFSLLYKNFLAYHLMLKIIFLSLDREKKLMLVMSTWCQ
jgi:hypothetical protein